jgi:hypothetical protein
MRRRSRARSELLADGGPVQKSKDDGQTGAASVCEEGTTSLTVVLARTTVGHGTIMCLSVRS